MPLTPASGRRPEETVEDKCNVRLCESDGVTRASDGKRNHSRRKHAMSSIGFGDAPLNDYRATVDVFDM